MTVQRKVPSLIRVNQNLAVRGNIYSSDNFKIARSIKIFQASINTKSLDPKKKELFIKLFSIYSHIPENKIRKRINNQKRKGYLVLSHRIDQRSAKDIKELAVKLRSLSVFKRDDTRNILYGLDIHEIGEQRQYPYKDALTPVIGFMRTNNNSGKQRVNGIKGLEKEFNEELNDMTNGILKGERDIRNYIIFNKNSEIIQREDGKDIHLTIPLRLQKNIELMLDRYKKKLGAYEIIASVMDSRTGKVLSLASSNRYDPTRLKPTDIQHTNVNAIEYNFEPGSVIKPISLALAIEKNKIDDNELLFAYNKGKKNSKGEYRKGKIKVGRWRIGDDHNFKKNYINLEDIFIYSSNIGTATIANRLSAEEFYYGFKDFGLSIPTGIDLPYEKRGLIHKIYQYRAGEDKGTLNIFKTTDSYGQGMTSTFIQVLKAYSTFNNNGKIVTPYIVKKNNLKPPKQIISQRTANKIKKLLIKTVQQGTGTKAKIEGLEVGGKTGTANIVEKGRYQRKYMSSFFGFVNDKQNRYTIGITVNDPISRGKYWYYYYASHSAVPVFKEVTKILLKLNYLKLDK
ncbi:MAG: penicillin-binding protein 2 [Campylobacterota bacterium]|nr:penicillin-binding protein 2 [Campylobacterota bacterium]